MNGIATFDKDATVDVIVVTRGGSADKTLRMFNETPLRRVIANTDTPTAVGIGQEDGRTLADEVADIRFMTPTDAGKIIRIEPNLIGSTPSLRTDSIRPTRRPSKPNSPPRKQPSAVLTRVPLPVGCRN